MENMIMRFLLLVVSVLVMSAAPARGAIATFVDVQNDVLAGTPVIFSVSVAAEELAGFQTVDMVIGWREAGDLTFEYDAGFITAMDANLVDPPLYDFFSPPYTNDVTIGGSSMTDLGTSILVGQVTLETDGLALGEYLVQVDPTPAGDYGWSMLYLGAQTELLFGSGYLRVVPEPTTIALLALGGLLLTRRRRLVISQLSLPQTAPRHR